MRRTTKQYHKEIRIACLETMFDYYAMRVAITGYDKIDINNTHEVINSAAQLLDQLSMGQVDTTPLKQTLTPRAHIPQLRPTIENIQAILNTYEPLQQLFSITMNYQPPTNLNCYCLNDYERPNLLSSIHHRIIRTYSTYRTNLQLYPTIEAQPERIEALLTGIPATDIITEPLHP